MSTREVCSSMKDCNFYASSYSSFSIAWHCSCEAFETFSLIYEMEEASSTKLWLFHTNCLFSLFLFHDHFQYFLMTLIKFFKNLFLLRFLWNFLGYFNLLNFVCFFIDFFHLWILFYLTEKWIRLFSIFFFLHFFNLRNDLFGWRNFLFNFLNFYFSWTFRLLAEYFSTFDFLLSYLLNFRLSIRLSLYFLLNFDGFFLKGNFRFYIVCGGWLRFRFFDIAWFVDLKIILGLWKSGIGCPFYSHSPK